MALSDLRHIARLLGWGRVLARHGALRGIERDANTPAAVRRLCRIARFGTFQPAVPDYAGAFGAIGMIAGPILVSLALALLEFAEEERGRSAVQSAP